MSEQLAVEDDWDQEGGEQQTQEYHDENGQQGYNDQQHDEDDILGEDGMGNQQHLPMEDEGVLLMRFCPHDSSMLYPMEDKRNRSLRHACRLCSYSEESHTALIYRNLLKKEVGNVLHTVPSAVSDDPTLPRSYNTNCDNCGHNVAVFFQGDTSDIRSDSLALIFVCCSCDHKW
eukprot:CAMPEP_0195509938 /NCGR_PEP_ID=MMETSP0794_2-20130614/2723_1 /TAXON_ID=515487 /ORGANISM="Stephanopyxis turris, Strain CCMP 815" /LENGTH=173 /DNA_ID=CAMNT_0040637267 /DNA_START=208 /DNA_END=726 /DNA_ORIENTATION=+